MADYIKPVVFKVGELLYGVDINLAQSIEKQVKVVPVPNATDYIKGIVNLRNEVIPLYSLKRKFKMKDEGYTECSIIVNTGEVKLALEVDDVIEIGDIKPENIMKMPSIIKNDSTRFMDRVAHIGKDLAVLMDVCQMLSDDEVDNLKKMTEELQ